MSHCAWLKLLKTQSSPQRTYFFQQCHTYSNKVIRPNSVTPYEPMGAFLFRSHRQPYDINVVEDLGKEKFLLNFGKDGNQYGGVSRNKKWHYFMTQYFALHSTLETLNTARLITA